MELVWVRFVLFTYGQILNSDNVPRMLKIRINTHYLFIFLYLLRYTLGVVGLRAGAFIVKDNNWLKSTTSIFRRIFLTYLGVLILDFKH